MTLSVFTTLLQFIDVNEHSFFSFTAHIITPPPLYITVARFPANMLVCIMAEHLNYGVFSYLFINKLHNVVSIIYILHNYTASWTFFFFFTCKTPYKLEQRE